MEENIQKREAVNPTKQHSIKCPKLFGEECACDGYHTFDELYDHRITLYIALCRWMTQEPKHYEMPWRSKKHSDGEFAFGGTWFVLGIGKEAGKQITYHLPIERWNETDFAETLEKAPIYDNHSSDDVLNRLKYL